MTDGAATVSFRDAGKRFGDTWAVEGLDVEMAPGTIVGLIGPSGCGKTTTVRLATGVYRPDSGEVTLLGRAPSEMRASEREVIGYLPQQPALFDQLSLWENLNFYASVNGVGFRRRDRLHEVLDLVDLSGEEKKLVAEASGGMRRRLALAATLVHDARVLVLDEPTAGIDPILRRRFWERFRRLSDEGRTLIVTTQYIGETADCDVVVMLAEGRVIALGAPGDLRREAFGGERIEVEVDRVVDGSVVALFERLDTVDAVEVVGRSRVRMVAPDATVALPSVLKELEGSDIGVVDAGEVIVDYDEVFIELVEKSSAGTSAGTTRDATGDVPDR